MVVSGPRILYRGLARIWDPCPFGLPAVFDRSAYEPESRRLGGVADCKEDLCSGSPKVITLSGGIEAKGALSMQGSGATLLVIIGAPYGTSQSWFYRGHAGSPLRNGAFANGPEGVFHQARCISSRDPGSTF